MEMEKDQDQDHRLAIIGTKDLQHPGQEKVAWAESESRLKFKTWKNVILLGVIYCMAFAAFYGLSDIQSSLFIDQGLGVICRSVFYSSQAVGLLILPKLVIRRLGHTWAIGACLIGYVAWMGTNGFATWITMVPSSVIAGVCGGILWTAHGAFINALATEYAKRTGRSIIEVSSLFFGVTMGIFKMSRVFGSLLSWGVLQHTMRNSSASISEENLEWCGARDCPSHNTTNVYFEKPQPFLLWILVGIYCAIGLCSIMLAFFGLDSIPESWYKSNTPIKPRDEVKRSVTAAVRLHLDYRQILLVPISMHSGMIQTYVQADFNKSFVTCSLGVWMVGLVSLPSALSNAGGSIVAGRLAKKLGWLPLLLFAFFLDAGVLIGCLFWKPHPDKLYVHLLISFLLGTDGIWQALTNSLVGITFPKDEAAFGNYRLWGAVGFALSFAVTRFLCVEYKIYLTLAILTLGIIGCIVLYKHPRPVTIDL